jgi:histidine triad (HIT) family protein
MNDCIFCQIAKKERNARIVFEDEKTAAFYDIHPQAPYHILVIPKKHITNVFDLKEEDKDLIGHIFLIINKIARDLNLFSFRIVTNSGREAGQSVFHLHFHLLSGRFMHWPPG